MPVYLIFISGFVATVAMTLFDYLIGWLTNRRFIVPEVLNTLLSRAPSVAFFPEKNHFAGWIIHFSIGMFFATAFYLVFLFTNIGPGFLSGAALGLLAGVVGISGWAFLFRIHSNPPEIHLKKFLFQLLLAHVVFGMGIVLGYFIF